MNINKHFIHIINVVSILDLSKTMIAPKRKITKNFLKKHGFYMDRWGGLQDRKKPTSIFYEALVGDNGIIPLDDLETTPIATIKYFPADFDGYTNFNTTNKDGQKGIGFGVVAGKLVITYEDMYWCDNVTGEGTFKDTVIFDCKTHTDFYDAIAIFNIDLNSKDYGAITF